MQIHLLIEAEVLIGSRCWQPAACLLDSSPALHQAQLSQNVVGGLQPKLGMGEHRIHYLV